MKTHLIFTCLLFLGVVVEAQTKDVTIFEKNDIINNSTVTRSIDNTPSEVTPSSSTADSIDSTDLIVYFKPGCSRCESFLKMLKEKGITCTSVDMSTDDPRIPQLWKDIQAQGFNGGTIHYPIIRYKGKVTWDMIDMNAFIESLPHWKMDWTAAVHDNDFDAL